MRIIIYEPFGCGGVCHYTYQLAQSLVGIGVDVTVVTQENYELKDMSHEFKLNGQLGKSKLKMYLNKLIHDKKCNVESQNEKQINRNNVNIEKSSLVNIRRWLIWTEVIAYLLLNKQKIIHIQWLLYPHEDYYFLKILRLLKIKIVYTAHNILPHDKEFASEINIFRKIYRLVDKIIVHADNNKMEIIDIFDINQEKIKIIPHGIYDMFLAKKSITQEAARSEIGIPMGKKVVLFFGIIRKYKGLEYLVEAFEEVKRKVNDAFLLIVGKVGGDEEEKKYYSELLSQFRNCNDVRCINEYIPFENVGSYFSASDIVVLPYIKTYQSGILLLAYAAAKPVIVTETGGLSETVEEGKSGFIVPSGDARSLAQGIIMMLESTLQMNQMGKYGKVLADTKYSWKNIADKTLEVYQQL